MNNNFVSTDPMDTGQTMETIAKESPTFVEPIVAEIPTAEVKVKPIQEIAQGNTVSQSTFTAQDLVSETSFVKDNGGFYGVPGGSITIAQYLDQKSNGKYSLNIRDISKN